LPSPEERVDTIAAQLAAAGFAPLLRDRHDHIAIEVNVPDQTSAESWEVLLTQLASADWFGHVVSTERGHAAWAGVYKKTPAATPVAQRHGPSALGS